jgi:hypothetical protein
MGDLMLDAARYRRKFYGFSESASRWFVRGPLPGLDFPRFDQPKGVSVHFTTPSDSGNGFWEAALSDLYATPCLG